MDNKNFNIKGLSDAEVEAARKRYGSNISSFKKRYTLLNSLKSLATEPMVVLLIVTAVIYQLSGETGDAVFLLAAIIFVSAISLYQDSRSRKALEKLKEFVEPQCKVIRNNEVVKIKSDDLVIGDCMMVEEGNYIPADGVIIHSNDFSVNESLLTGETFSVYKDKQSSDNRIYKGTSVSSGLAIAAVQGIGNDTRIGQIGKSIESIKEEKTPLEIQIGSFVRKMVIAGTFIFFTVWGINYYLSSSLSDSLLKALTLAMSILPEEIPVAFTTFMALGAWRLMKLGIVVKQMKTVETLGSATVICIDKTGTITENKMTLARLYIRGEDDYTIPGKDPGKKEQELIRYAMWASEPIPFDPMEVALHKAYENSNKDERPLFRMIHEYPLGGKPPMMTHLFEDASGRRLIAAKGAPEAILAVSDISDEEKRTISERTNLLSSEGYRVLGVASSSFTGNDFPETQQELNFTFKGIVAFNDPPKKNIGEVFNCFYKAGIKIKIITGDNAETTAAVAKQTGFTGADRCISGEDLIKLDDVALANAVDKNYVFTRMFPEAKLRIINALKNKNEIVAMTGDGVNDAPALRAAHIGVAMGKKGTEIAKEAASLVLADDELQGMVNAVAMGRKIYTNLKKAIRYIISIHIPIILTVFIPLAFGWVYPNIFTPVHIIFLELIMGPTCSIIYENEPIEANTMLQKPRPFTTTFFNMRELSTSIFQGLAITAGALLVYRMAVINGENESVTRTMVFVVLITANIFLTLVNRSFYFSIFTTIRYKNILVPLIIAATVALSTSLIYIPPFANFFEFESLQLSDLLTGISAGFLSVIWFEAVKAWQRNRYDLSHSDHAVL